MKDVRKPIYLEHVREFPDALPYFGVDPMTGMGYMRWYDEDELIAATFRYPAGDRRYFIWD